VLEELLVPVAPPAPPLAVDDTPRGDLAPHAPRSPASAKIAEAAPRRWSGRARFTSSSLPRRGRSPCRPSSSEPAP
jgi:hypothetical protein